MFYKGKKFQTVALKSAMVGFLNYLKEIKKNFSTPEISCHIILVGHNAIK